MFLDWYCTPPFFVDNLRITVGPNTLGNTYFNYLIRIEDTSYEYRPKFNVYILVRTEPDAEHLCRIYEKIERDDQLEENTEIGFAHRRIYTIGASVLLPFLPPIEIGLRSVPQREANLYHPDKRRAKSPYDVCSSKF